MRQRSLFRLMLAAVIIAGAVIGLQSFRPATEPESCKESLDGSCKSTDTRNKMSWESLPHQFFSSF